MDKGECDIVTLRTDDDEVCARSAPHTPPGARKGYPGSQGTQDRETTEELNFK